jgi:hypothetical protein
MAGNACTSGRSAMGEAISTQRHPILLSNGSFQVALEMEEYRDPDHDPHSPQQSSSDIHQTYDGRDPVQTPDGFDRLRGDGCNVLDLEGPGHLGDPGRPTALRLLENLIPSLLPAIDPA